MDTLSPSPLAEEYRAMLDAERAMKLSRGTNHEGEGKKEKKEKKEKKSKKSEDICLDKWGNQVLVETLSLGE